MQLGFLHYSLIRGPFFFQIKGSNQLLVFKTLFMRSGYFSFFNTSYPFLKTADFLHPKSGSLQNFYKMVDDSSFRSDEFFLLLN